VNSAGDFFEGLTTLDAEVRATISANRQVFPLAAAVAYTNAINNDLYLGAPKHTWLCAGISGQPAVEVVDGVEVRYWQITTELVYRASGHNLLLPDIGFNYLSGGVGGKKVPCWVYATDDLGNPLDTKIRASTPQKLKVNGDIDTEQGTPPRIIERRIYPELDFSVFGVPTL
jgi:hypothetical protein